MLLQVLQTGCMFSIAFGIAILWSQNIAILGSNTFRCKVHCSFIKKVTVVVEQFRINNVSSQLIMTFVHVNTVNIDCCVSSGTIL